METSRTSSNRVPHDSCSQSLVMKTAYLEEVDFAAFRRALAEAQRQGTAILPSDRSAWMAAIRANDYKAEAFAFMASQRYGAKDLVILTGAAPWKGLFAADQETQVCVQLR